MSDQSMWYPNAHEVLDGRYELLRVLSTTPRAANFLAQDRALNRRVVLKYFHPVFAGAEVRETNTFRLFRARGFKHAHIVSVDDVVVKDDCLYLTKEVVEALDLRTLQRLRMENLEPFTKKELIQLSWQICDALKWVHMLGAAGSLKPENVLVTETLVKLDDPFLLVAPSANLEPSHYTAPEQRSEPFKERKESDIYSLSLIVGEVLVGKQVKPGIPLSDQGPFFSPELDDIFLKGTNEDPGVRYDNVADVWNALRSVFRISSEEVAKAASVGFFSETVRGSWRKSSMLSLGFEAASEPPAPLELEPLAPHEEAALLEKDAGKPATVAQEPVREEEKVLAPTEGKKEPFELEEYDLSTRETVRYTPQELDREVFQEPERHEAPAPEPPPAPAPEPAPEPESAPMAAPEPAKPATSADDVEDIERIIEQSGDLLLEVEVEEIPELPEEMKHEPAPAEPPVEAPVEVSETQVLVTTESPKQEEDDGLIIIGEAEEKAAAHSEPQDGLIIIGEGEKPQTAELATVKDVPRTDGSVAVAGPTTAMATPVPAGKAKSSAAPWVILLLVVLAAGGGVWWALQNGKIQIAGLNVNTVAEQQKQEKEAAVKAALAEQKAAEEAAEKEKARVKAEAEAKAAREASEAEEKRKAALDEKKAPVRNSLGELTGKAEGLLSIITGEVNVEGLPEGISQRRAALLESGQKLKDAISAKKAELDAANDDDTVARCRTAAEGFVGAVGDLDKELKAFLTSYQAVKEDMAAKNVVSGQLQALDAKGLPALAAACSEALEKRIKHATAHSLKDKAAAMQGAKDRLAQVFGIFTEARKALDGLSNEELKSRLVAVDSQAQALELSVAECRSVVRAYDDEFVKTLGETVSTLSKKLGAKIEEWRAVAGEGTEQEIRLIEDHLASSGALVQEAGNPAPAELTGAEAVGAWLTARLTLLEKLEKESQVLAYLLRKPVAAGQNKALLAMEKELKSLAAGAEALGGKLAAKAAEWMAVGNGAKAGALEKERETLAALAGSISDLQTGLSSMDEATAKGKLAGIRKQYTGLSKKIAAMLKEKVEKAAAPAEVKEEPNPKAALDSKSCPGGMKKMVIKGKGEGGFMAYCIDYFEYPGKGEKPRTNVSFQAAKAACTAGGKRLCDAHEWRAACGAKYPYGKTYDPEKCNTVDEEGLERPVLPAGSKPDCKSPSGLFDMVGNVAEWTSDETVNGGDSVKTAEDATCARGAKRFGASRSIGFRCCADPK